MISVGDLVRRKSHALEEVGIVLDVYESEEGLFYYEVQWPDCLEWWIDVQLEMASESR